jgi:hypothetical protein
MRVLKWGCLGTLGLMALLVLFVGCVAVIGTLQGPTSPGSSAGNEVPGGADVRRTEEHKEGDVSWAYFAVIEPYATRSDELKIAHYVRDNQAKDYDLAYVLYKEAEGSGVGSYAVIVNTEAGLAKDKEVARDQHYEAAKAWNSEDHIYLWHMS